MRYTFILLSIMTLALESVVFASSAPPPTSVGPSQTGPTTITRPPLGGTPSSATGAKQPTKSLPPPPKPLKFSYRPSFTQPGILTLRGAGFVGVDHLYNLSGTIPVVVELVKSESLQIAVSKEKIQIMIEKMFEREGINPAVRPSEGPALPFFHMLIMIVPSGEGVAAFCSGRIFEKVELERVALPVGVYFQAITWEYQNLISSSKEDIDKQLDGAVSEVVQQFLSRFKYYKNVQQQPN